MALLNPNPPSYAGPVEQGFIGQGQAAGAPPSGYAGQPPQYAPDQWGPPAPGGSQAPSGPSGPAFGPNMPPYGGYDPNTGTTLQNPMQGAQAGQPPQDPTAPVMQRTDFGFMQGGLGVPIPGFGNTIDYSQLDPYTRQVGEEETARYQIESLLDDESRYMQNAVRRGERAAAARGGLSSSLFAGASQRAAIESALPIASQDAQTYGRVASENAAAINQNTIAKMNSMTSALNSQIGAMASVTSSQIAARANQSIAQLRVRAEENQNQFLAEQERFMQDIRQMDEMELMELEQQYNLDLGAMEFGYQSQLLGQRFGYDTQLAAQAQQYALDRIGYEGSWNDYLLERELDAGMISQGMNMVMSLNEFLSTQDLDEAGYDAALTRGMREIQQFFDLYNSLGDPDSDSSFEPIGGGGG